MRGENQKGLLRFVKGLSLISIYQGAVRICKKDYDDDRAKQYGPLDRWYMVDCFAETRDQMMFFCSADKLPGFNTLSKDDQVLIAS